MLFVGGPYHEKEFPVDHGIKSLVFVSHPATSPAWQDEVYSSVKIKYVVGELFRRSVMLYDGRLCECVK